MDSFEARVDPGETEADLLGRAQAAMRNAYARYSKFSVGAAIRTERGGVYAACNVENVSFPVGTCAERNAIASAVASEGPTMRVRTMVVVAEKAGRQEPCTPCGACRQALMEFGPDAKVLHRSQASWRCDTASDLLPFGFTFDPDGR